MWCDAHKVTLLCLLRRACGGGRHARKVRRTIRVIGLQKRENPLFGLILSTKVRRTRVVIHFAFFAARVAEAFLGAARCAAVLEVRAKTPSFSSS